MDKRIGCICFTLQSGLSKYIFLQRNLQPQPITHILYVGFVQQLGALNIYADCRNRY